ncbi:MAG: LytTR family DNA-binding domain-containing protein [Sediminibacterium sp.]|nr:LytTR family DNA-binding domain-containing protein [Sediminibacterium sp.]
MKYNVVVIDDEPLAIQVILFYFKNHPEFDVLNTFSNPNLAISYIIENQHQIQLVLLDIEMPNLKGIDLARQLPQHIEFIFTTAYAEFAVDSYEISALDYLLKPIKPERFSLSLQKFIALQNQNRVATEQFIVVKIDGFSIKIFPSRILYIKAFKDYLKIYFNDQTNSGLVRLTMKKMHSMLPNNLFVRTNRSYLVNKNAITKQNKKSVFINNFEIPYSK